MILHTLSHRCGVGHWPECITAACVPPSSSSGHTEDTRLSRTSTRSTDGSETCVAWRITANMWSGPHRPRSCASLKRHWGTSITGQSYRGQEVDRFTGALCDSWGSQVWLQLCCIKVSCMAEDTVWPNVTITM